MAERTKPDEQTRSAERAEADEEHAPDRMPTPDEERRAEEHEADTSVAAHAKEMAERGKNQQGEGRVP
jgi:hypothetical protein